MVMEIVLILCTIFTAYGIIQTKKQGNVFGFAFSSVSFFIFLFTTALAIMM